MFRKLPVFSVDEEPLRQLADSMREDGDDEPGDNPDIPAGYTYMGQFIDHDITFDPTSSLQRANDPEALENFRTPRYDLDSVYGQGRADSPYLYDKDSRGGLGLLLGRAVDDDGNEVADEDLPRNSQDTALTGDPRNDENTFISQMQVLFIKFHNKVVDRIFDEGKFDKPDDVFKEAQRLVRWHYQWVVVHDFLPRIAGQDIVDDILQPQGQQQTRRRFYKWKDQPYMPVEFSVAAYRFGHSMIRRIYSLNELVQSLPIFPDSDNPGRLEAFHGFRALPPRWAASWPFFFELDDQGPQLARKIDTRLAGPLFRLPGSADADLQSLARRNLLRGRALQLPSGERVAKRMGEQPLTKTELGIDEPGLTETPLWFYILKEAEVRNDGRRLGPVGGRVVAEVLLGLLDGDPLSYLSVEPHWQPELPSQTANGFTMPDLIRFAASEDAARHSGRQ